MPINITQLKQQVESFRSMRANISIDLTEDPYCSMVNESEALFIWLNRFIEKIASGLLSEVDAILIGRLFLGFRGYLIHNSNVSLAYHPCGSANLAFSALAEMLISPEETVCQLLHPSLMGFIPNIYSNIKEASEDLSGRYHPENYFVSSDGKHLVSIIEVFEYAMKNPDNIFGVPQTDPTQPIAPLTIALTPDEHQILKNIAGHVSRNYYQCLFEFHQHKHKGMSLGIAISCLARELAAASLNNKSNNAATEFSADFSLLKANDTIPKFYKIWRTFAENQPEQYNRIKNIAATPSSHFTLEIYFLTLFDDEPGCYLTEVEKNQVKEVNLLRCLKIISEILEDFLVQHKVLYEIRFDSAESACVVPDFFVMHERLIEALSQRQQVTLGNNSNFLKYYHDYRGCIDALFGHDSMNFEERINFLASIKNNIFSLNSNMSTFIFQCYITGFLGNTGRFFSRIINNHINTHCQLVSALNTLPTIYWPDLIAALGSRAVSLLYFNFPTRKSFYFHLILSELPKANHSALIIALGDKIKEIIQNQDYLILSLQKLSEASWPTLITALDDKVVRIIRGNEWCALNFDFFHTLLAFPETSWPVLISALNGKIQQIIKNGYELGCIINHLPEPKWLLFIAALGDKIQLIVKDSHELGSLLDVLPETNWRELIVALGDKIQLILQKGDTQLGCIFNAFYQPKLERWRLLIELLDDHVPDDNWLSVIVEIEFKNRFVLVAALDEKIRSNIKNPNQFIYALRQLPRENRMMLIAAISEKIKQMHLTYDQLSIILDLVPEDRWPDLIIMFEKIPTYFTFMPKKHSQTFTPLQITEIKQLCEQANKVSAVVTWAEAVPEQYSHCFALKAAHLLEAYAHPPLFSWTYHHKELIVQAKRLAKELRNNYLKASSSDCITFISKRISGIALTNPYGTFDGVLRKIWCMHQIHLQQRQVKEVLALPLRERC
ncbi:MAG TPA: hypothetical protein VHZ76_03245 [Gammaproteobacteria bacterium]|jgi:hypothetical protein|nr:hypothetical protein [Gammaproteobacteria bacterium]